MILGKYKKETIDKIQFDDFFELIDDFSKVSMEDLIKFFKDLDKKYNDLDKLLNLLEFVKEYQEKTEYISELINNYIDLLDSLNSVLNYNKLQIKKETLINELELSEIKKRSSLLAAKTDLLNKLNAALEKNRNRLKNFKQDYFKYKNQVNQITNTITTYNNDIKNLNKSKKDCFNYINKLTREMESEGQPIIQKEFNLPIEIENLSYSEQINALRKKARSIQNNINETKSKISESRQKLDKIDPIFKILERDYNSLCKTIKNDEDKVSTLKDELKDSLKENEEIDIDLSEIKFLKTPEEIKDEIQVIDNELTRIFETKKYINKKNPKDLSNIKDGLIELKEKLDLNKDKAIISLDKGDIDESIENFRLFEVLIKNIEFNLNKFLDQVNINTTLIIIIDDDIEAFQMELEFIRTKNKERVNFEQLTTPEKIFFVISFYLSCKVQLNSENIIFTNLMLPNNYNKQGSIFRTIRKILPIFEKEKSLSNISLVFLLSNVEMKKPIDNIRIIQIEESE